MEVVRASHTHQAPQVGLPQTAPVNSASAVIDMPNGTTVASTMSASFMRHTSSTSPAAPISM